MMTRREILITGLGAAAFSLTPAVLDGGQRRTHAHVVVYEPSVAASLDFASRFPDAIVLGLAHDPALTLHILDEGWQTGWMRKVSGLTRPVAFHLIESTGSRHGRFPVGRSFIVERRQGLTLNQWSIV